jgi:D-alanyl-D-alanine carboxypeptidase
MPVASQDPSDVPSASRGASARSNQRGTTRVDRYLRHTVLYSVIASLTVFACIAAPGAAASAAGPAATSLQQDIDALVAAGAPGAILLVRNGSNETRLTGGVAELATQRAITQADHYRIASLTKTYVATVVLQLVGEGKLRLGDAVERWLPGVVPNGDKITMRMLLNHTSGLYDHERDPEVLAPYLSGDLGYYWSPIRLVKLATSRPPLFAPGATKLSVYSSTNYVVLGLVVSAVTGRSIGAELKRRIFQPLHLAQTTYPTSKTQLPNTYAHGYLMLEPPTLTDLSGFSPSLSGPAGAIVSTVGDVARFYHALLSGRLLKPAQLKAMKTTLPEAKGDLVQRMGYGVIRFSTPCGAAWGHSGSFPGYWTHAWSSGDGKRQVVLMVNIDPTSVTAEANAAFYRTLGSAYCGTG